MPLTATTPTSRSLLKPGGYNQTSVVHGSLTKGPTKSLSGTGNKKKVGCRNGVLRINAIAAPELGTAETFVENPKEMEKSLNLPYYNFNDWAQCFRSQPKEYDYWIDEIEGTIPEELKGTLFRNGPGNFQQGKDRYKHMLDGDGYVCTFSFAQNGRVHFKSKYVATKERDEEKNAGKILFRNSFGTQRAGGALTNAFDLELKNPANTNIVLWGGRLLALWEAGAPYEMDPSTLDTHPEKANLGGWLTHGIAPSTTGSDALDGVLGIGAKACTAHPHIVPGGRKEREVTVSCAKIGPNGSHKFLFNGFNLEGNIKATGSEMKIEIAEYDASWRTSSSTRLILHDQFISPHDFAVTQHSYVFFQNGMKFDMMPYLLGTKGPAECVDFSDQPMKIHIVPRGKGDPMCVETEATFLIHHANGFEDGDEVVVWSSGWDPETVRRLAKNAGRGIFGSWGDMFQGDMGGVPVTCLWEHRINRFTGKVARRPLYEMSNDHPRVNPKFYSKPTRFVYTSQCIAEEELSCGPPQAWARLDVSDPRSQPQVWSPGPRSFCEELVFVPGRLGDKVEDDGYLLGMVYDAEVGRSSLVVMDAKDFNKGPIARVWLTHMVPHGLHGNFSKTYYGPK